MKKVKLFIDCLVLVLIWDYVSWASIVAGTLIGLLGILFNYSGGAIQCLFYAAIVPLLCAAVTGHLGAADALLLFVTLLWFFPEWYRKPKLL